MNDILKQRLVGALILVALGVVFWPIIFVEPGERSSPGRVEIPPPPLIDTSTIEPPAQGELRGSPESEPEAGMAQVEVAEGALDANAPVPSAAPTPGPQARSTPPQQPALDNSGLPVGWILQVATVSNPAKADELRDTLLASGEKAYVKKLEAGGKVLYRVSIGPNVERAQLEKIQPQID
nr:SPOR domain-containing protein [Halioglobus sp.]